MSVLWKIAAVTLCGLIGTALPSITGVTYMDHFDFEERYRDIHECDPIYWHPLPLPDHCARMFNELIRQKVPSAFPMRIVRNRNEALVSNAFPSYDIFGNPVYKIKNHVINSDADPHNILLDMLRRDIEKEPSEPQIAIVPNLGAVVVYQQPISRKSEHAIKNAAEAYAKAYVEMYPKDSSSEYEVSMYPGKHKTEQETNETDVEQTTTKKPKVYRKKYRFGNKFAIIEKSGDVY